MTEADLDKLMHQILLDSLRLELADTLNVSLPKKNSQKFRYQMKAMLANPFLWYHKKICPVWKKALQTAVTITIVTFLTFGMLIATSPTVRAAIVQWVREWYDSHIIYRYLGEATEIEIPNYEIANLQGNYVEVNRVQLPGYESVTYQNSDGKILYLDYSFMQQGSATNFVKDYMNISEITVNGYVGQLLLSEDASQSNAITWIDGNANIQFTIDGFLNREELLRTAESTKLIE